MNGSVKPFISRNSLTHDHPAMVGGTQTLSYSQFLHAVSRTEQCLRDSGIQNRARVGIQSHNSADYLIALFALWRIGAVACLFSPRLPQKTLAEQLSPMGCVKILTPKDLALIGKLSSDEKQEGLEEFDVPLAQEVTILFTSGTSAAPKAVLHTFGNHFYNAKGANAHLPVVPGDQWLLSLPLYHVGGLGIVFRTFLGGGSIVIPGPDDPIETMLEKHKITHLSLVPTQLIRLLENPNCHAALKALKVILVGGSPIPKTVLDEAIRRQWPVYTTYGSTEMASQVATSTRLSSQNGISSGKVLNYRKLMIAEDGEILLQGETLFKGYLDRGSVSRPFNENGYFLTGDLGDFLENGHLIIKGRKDNMFISGGENIHPEEIEGLLCRIERVERAIVVPVSHEEFGFRPVAFIRVKEAVSQEKILTALKNDLPHFKIPDRFYSWPKNTGTGDLKLNRHYFSELIGDPSRLPALIT